MKEFPNITAMLKTSFNAEDGLPEEVSIRLYKKAISSNGKLELLKQELETAFSSTNVSWKELLFNDNYEVRYAETEEEARIYARRILWEPLFSEHE